MALYVSVRGWLELMPDQRDAVQEVLDKHEHDLYSAGWHVPARWFNSTLYVTYGGNVRADWVGWVHAHVAEIAKFVDEHGDHPIGFFVLTGEMDYGRAWLVRDGEVHEGAAPEGLLAIDR